RRPIASLNYLLTSHVWRQDHNGFSHQDPGFIDHVVNKKAEVVRVYLPPDANTLLSVADHCLRSRHYVNVIVAGKQPALQYLSMDDAIAHCTRGIGIWDWASNDDGAEPDVVLACCGDVPTLETLAAVANLRVRGYKEEGTTTTPFDMVMLNDLDRYHLVMDVIDRVPGLADSGGHVRQEMTDARLRARMWTREHGEDHPDVRDWAWPF